MRKLLARLLKRPEAPTKAALPAHELALRYAKAELARSGTNEAGRSDVTAPASAVSVVGEAGAPTVKAKKPRVPRARPSKAKRKEEAHIALPAPKPNREKPNREKQRKPATRWLEEVVPPRARPRKAKKEQAHLAPPVPKADGEKRRKPATRWLEELAPPRAMPRKAKQKDGAHIAAPAPKANGEKRRKPATRWLEELVAASHVVRPRRSPAARSKKKPKAPSFL
jgi:hypothetical protein